MVEYGTFNNDVQTQRGSLFIWLLKCIAGGPVACFGSFGDQMKGTPAIYAFIGKHIYMIVNHTSWPSIINHTYACNIYGQLVGKAVLP